MSLRKDIAELLQAGVISPEVASNIERHYAKSGPQSGNRLFIAFGVLGSTLVGLGIILILAHNWDDLSRAMKTFFAFLPVLLGQLACVYTVLRKADNTGWRESAATFLFFAVGACIALVSQIYNIPGDLSGYMLTWTLLGLPLIYILRSSMASLLFLIGITTYAIESNGFSSTYCPHWYWLLLLAMVPHYLTLIKTKPSSNFSVFHHWLIPICLTIALLIFNGHDEELLFPAYICLFALFYGIGHLPIFDKLKRRSVGYLIIGGLGTLVLLLVGSFRDFWKELGRKEFMLPESLGSSEFLSFAILLGLALFVFVKYTLPNMRQSSKPMAPVFLLFVPLFFVGYHTSTVVFIVNLLILYVGVRTIQLGAKEDHLGVMNLGLLIITALVVCRFFDTDLSFVLRGLLFIGVGAGFFIANYKIIRKRKEHEA